MSSNGPCMRPRSSFSSGADPENRPRDGIGWFPLGPREVYVPPYGASPTYVQRINVTTVNISVTTIERYDVTRVTYVNRMVPSAVTVVPRGDFKRGRPASGAPIFFTNDQVQRAPIMGMGATVAPQRESIIGGPFVARNPPPQPPPQVAGRSVFGRIVPAPAPAPFQFRPEPLPPSTMYQRPPVQVAPQPQGPIRQPAPIRIDPMYRGPAFAVPPGGQQQPGPAMQAPPQRQPLPSMQPRQPMQPQPQPMQPMQPQPQPYHSASSAAPARLVDAGAAATAARTGHATAAAAGHAAPAIPSSAAPARLADAGAAAAAARTGHATAAAAGDAAPACRSAPAASAAG